ncbi:MAG: flavin-containing monooxygenase [Candidatus Dormibacteria bacterium]
MITTPAAATTSQRPTSPVFRAAPAAGDGSLPHFKIAIIGTGFAGLGMAIRLLQKGERDFVVLERAGEVGGTWRDNTYPGCQCDVPSHLYSFSFAPNPNWTRAFSRQPEIWEYLRGCVRKFGVTPHIRFNHAVTMASWDEDKQRWTIETAGGTITANVMISGMGGLSEPFIPPLAGLDKFKGTYFHSATWNHEHDLKGRRVAVVGTGASSIQFVPRIQREVGQMFLYQRTPPWIMPHRDKRLAAWKHRLYNRFPAAQKLVRSLIYWGREGFVPFFINEKLAGVPKGIALKHLENQVADPGLRARLTPDYQVGCKRILISNDYYPALQQPNVEVVSDGIKEIREHSIVSTDGTEREVDTIIFGTGFHVTDSPYAERIRGRDGQLLSEVFEGSPQALRGTTVAGFPNAFILLGPNTGLGHTSVVVMVEAQVNYVLDCLRFMDRNDAVTIEARDDAQQVYNQKLQGELKDTVWNAGGCSSWYLDASGRNSTLWPTYTWKFIREMRHFRPAEFNVRSGQRARSGEPALKEATA